MKRAERIIRAINKFDRQCRHAEYTDTDLVWHLLYWIKGQLKPEIRKVVRK